MAVAAQTNKTYDVTTIREDLHSAMTSLTPTDTIFMSTIGSRNVDNTYFEWSEVDLAATGANRQLEGDALGNTFAMLFARGICRLVRGCQKYPQLTTQ